MLAFFCIAFTVKYIHTKPVLEEFQFNHTFGFTTCVALKADKMDYQNSRYVYSLWESCLGTIVKTMMEEEREEVGEKREERRKDNLNLVSVRYSELKPQTQQLETTRQ